MMSLDRRPVQQNYYPQQIPNVGIQFTNPFPSQTTSASSAQLLATTLGTDGSFPRQTTSAAQSYALNGTSGMTDRMAQPYFSTDMFSQNPEIKFGNAYDTTHSMPESSAASPTATTFPVTSVGAPTIFDFTSNPLHRMSVLANESRRMSTPSVPSSSFLGAPVELPRQRQNSMIDWRGMNAPSTYSNLRHENFTDTIDSARGMLAMSQSARHRIRQDSQHGYYSTNHSNTSSISSNGSYQPYYDTSATEVSTGENTADPVSRTLPRPNGYVPGNAPQSMMSTFSSKITSSTQKKHRCKICDKRFTRPSSLLTHTYSHTGEKPFKCEVEGCGRNFSVVSNLRRHKKVHRNQQQQQQQTPQPSQTSQQPQSQQTAAN